MHQPLATPPRRLPVQLGHTLSLVLLAVALGAWSPAHAQWKWRDKAGQINVSDRAPPKDVPEKDILARPVPDQRRPAEPAAPASSASAPARSEVRVPVDRELEARKLAADQEKAARLKAEEDKVAATRAENCRRARGHVAALEGGQRIGRVNEKGEQEVLDDKGRAEELRRSREIIAADCR
jgi:type IV secretory pathway VirB10-like protein